ncbi:DUF4430 domain-containing protein [Aquibacillus koreensis]|uniref:DUF4430 domain-containing protein n=1 Tax=Aquibacillus koreensis TaxID=279446 RepID=A0A9X4AI01_9BACI|nr:DUF4430 domain-containing protein [Aquibacillus koreensis]MCT2537424.1 DUF4430 domain-containing protein [Aquibacillus koreensis]MDC3418870.1 DUF4430 domain-containing protein [Aquibacillus koreensis]
MKKFYASLLSLFLMLGILMGCAEEDNANPETESDSAVSITISQDNGAEVIAEEEIVIEEGAILMDVLEENFEVEKSDQGFITSIEGIAQDDENGKYWMYDVNGEEATVGANDYELNPDDKVVFDLHGME